jgi:CheY-like chemotaxis protein
MSKSKRLVYIDDDEDDILVLAEILLQIDDTIECLAAIGAQEGLALLDKIGVPQYIFLDINMPRINGKQCLQRLRADRRYDDVPVIMLSTSTSDSEIKECMTLGATAFLVKATDLKNFTERLRVLLNSIEGHEHVMHENR